MKSELETLYAQIKDMTIAMMTTRRRDGHLESRAMATQKPASGADLWFVTADGTAKLDAIGSDPHVLIGVDIHAAVFLEVNKPKPVVLYELVKGWVTGTMPDVGETHVVGVANRRGRT